MLHDWGGTTTADRRDWQRIISTGLAEGWYEVGFGEIARVERPQDGRLAVYLRQGHFQQEVVSADYLIICTGLEGSLENHALLQDLVELYQVARTPQGSLQVTGDFEVSALRNGTGRCFACGVMTAGNAFAPVDSFLGLQYAALSAVDHLAHLAPDVHRLTVWRSLVQWVRWVLGVQP